MKCSTFLRIQHGTTVKKLAEHNSDFFQVLEFKIKFTYIYTYLYKMNHKLAHYNVQFKLNKNFQIHFNEQFKRCKSLGKI